MADGGFNFGSGGMFDGFTNFINQKPEQFAILLDSMGKGLAPKNPMAGIGTMMGQSSLANQAYQKQQADKDTYMKALIKAAGGMTPAGETGVTSMTHGINKDGIPELTMKLNPAGGTSALGTLAPTQQPQQPQQQLNTMFGVPNF
jgi:hypothetical protein